MHAEPSIISHTTVGRQLRILVVEDEALLSLELEMLLADWGYSVVGSAASGEEGIDAALELQPDIVLMDINLGSGIDGISAAAAIRHCRDTRFVFMTAYAVQDIASRLDGLDAPVLHKPIRTDILRGILSDAAADLG